MLNLVRFIIHRKGLIVGLLSVAAILFLWTIWWEPASLRLHEECISIERAPARPLRVALIADLHVGSPFNGPAKLKQVTEQTNRAGVDAVFLLGDFVISGVLGGTFVSPEEIAGELSRLKPARGVFAVLGNHDAWFNARRVERALADAGIHVLEDRAVKVETVSGSFWLAGISDFLTGRHDIRRALEDVPREALLLAITHNPDVFPELPDQIDFAIAGHTHGGQVRLPLVGSPVVPSRYGQRFAAGHIVENGRHLYVATGIGTSILPVRFGVPPSIVILSIASTCPE